DFHVTGVQTCALPICPSEIDTADLSEVILSLGYGPFSFAYYDNVAGGSGYEYYTLGASFGQFAVNVGKHDNVVGDDPVHVDLSRSEERRVGEERRDGS